MMEKGKENEEERAEEKANISSVLFSALREDIANVLDFIERLKNEENQEVLDVDQVKNLKLGLAFVCAFLQLSYSNLEQFECLMTSMGQKVENLLRSIFYDVDNNVGCKHDIHRVVVSLMDNINHCISSHHHSESSATMLEEQLNFLLLNLCHLAKYFAEHEFPLESQYEILRNVCGNMKDFHGLIVNGCVEHEIVKCVLPQFQFMAERVGRFLWDNVIDGKSHLLKLAHLLLKIIPIELEVMHICYTNLQASPLAEVGRFIKQLLETSPDILRECLIHLQEHMVTVITASTPGARNIHVMMEFLLIILTDVPRGLIHHDKFFDLLARVGVLTREVLALVRDIEEKSRNKQSTNERNCATLVLQENIELLKKDLKHVY